ncbi:DUF1659 domain-containing protein [Bacillus timonensis]|nr:DUF1659 domain-containing protein [Bacillus timonensis]
MALANIQDTKLRLILEVGLDEKGNLKYKNKTYHNVKTSATADELYAVAVAIAGLQSLPLEDIERNDTHFLSE